MSDPPPRPRVAPDFACRDCDCDVYSFPPRLPPDPPLCAVCAWLLEFVPDPVERARRRAFLDLPPA